MAINNNVNTAYVMDRGIDRVVYGTQDQAKLPERQLLDPADATDVEQDPLQAPRSLGDALDEAIARPVVTEKGITHPGRFKEVFSSARVALQDETTQQPEHEKILKRAVRLLGEEEANLELLQMYRTGLFQG